MREPDPLRECRPGGSCPDCNAKPIYCSGLGCDNEVEHEDDLCDACDAKPVECVNCGAETDRSDFEERPESWICPGCMNLQEPDTDGDWQRKYRLENRS